MHKSSPRALKRVLDPIGSLEDFIELTQGKERRETFVRLSKQQTKYNLLGTGSSKVG
jgi:hypothetical protein